MEEANQNRPVLCDHARNILELGKQTQAGFSTLDQHTVDL